MGRRRKARELALQLLFHREFNRESPDWRDTFWTARPASEANREYADSLVDGIMKHLDSIDAMIAKSAQHWTLERMTAVDRNILRIAVYELKFGGTVPAKVCINEAVDIAKRFGDESSGAFVNGVLDHLHREQEPLISK